MGHFARINVTGKVDRVIVAEQPFIDTLPDSALWVQTCLLYTSPSPRDC